MITKEDEKLNLDDVKSSNIEIKINEIYKRKWKNTILGIIISVIILTMITIFIS